MTFYQLSFITFLRSGFIGALIILIIYQTFINDINKLDDKMELFSSPFFNSSIKKIDVGQGDDFWVLTYKGRFSGPLTYIYE